MQKNIFFRLIKIFSVVLACNTMTGNVFGADVCSTGTGKPPFLTSGVDPNLLLVLDNSGSMLDMAYTDKDLDADTDGTGPIKDGPDTASYCSDSTYNDPVRPYTGYFDQESWYSWDDSGVSYWEPETEKPLVYDNGILYQCKSGSCVGEPREDDGWEPVISENGTLPEGFTFVDGKLFQGTTPVDEGFFAVSASGCVGKASETAYSNDDVCIIINESLIPQKVVKFAATGKFLNWLSASKFDIQKKILTGGKYNAEANILISENRGCAGSGFLKEIKVSNETKGNKVLSFKVRGPVSGNPLEYENDKIGTSDNTTRIEILGLTSVAEDQDSALPEECQLAINEIMSGANLNGVSGNIDKCLESFRDAENEELTDQRPALNLALQFCQDLINDRERNLNAIIGKCEDIYEGNAPTKNAYFPSEINPYYGGYVCYGIYDYRKPHASRSGYIGRCWDPSAGGETSELPCAPKLATENCKLAPGATFCEYSDETTLPGYTLFRNILEDGNVYNKACPDNQIQTTKDGFKTCKKDDYFILLHTNTISTFDEPTCGVSTDQNLDDKWVPPDPPISPELDDTTHCILQASIDYCNTMRVPEVIDPSDVASTTSDFWNAPATLIDSGIIVAFGTDRPLAVMKGHVGLPEVEDSPVIPQGVIHEVKDDLRMGAMAFNVNGAGTECPIALEDKSSPFLDPFCVSTYLDGATVIVPIRNSDATIDGKTHLANLTQEINRIPATSWTPIAEAIYNGLGYYGQNENWRINPEDFQNNLVTDDPVKAWCQSNNILVITEGASTADINVSVKNKITELAELDEPVKDTTVAPGAEGECKKIVKTGEQHYLYGSTYLDDLTYFGQHAIGAGIYKDPVMLSDNNVPENKQNIKTYIISTSNAVGDPTDECVPATLMKNAAENGGTKLLFGENPEALEKSLRDALADILSRVSSGSSASVVSSARSGEGAIYQSIFWPEKESFYNNKKYIINWVGDVHGLFTDDKGYIYEDTNPNRTLDLDREDGINDRRVVVYYDDSDKRSKVCYGETTVINGGVTCTNSVELEVVKYLWSANDRLYDLSDVQKNREVSASTGEFDFGKYKGKKRYIFTWNDLNHNGYVDSSEVIGLEKSPIPETPEWITFAKEFFPDDSYTDEKQYGYELNNLISWLRGDDWTVDEDLNDDNIRDMVGDSDPIPFDKDPTDGPFPRQAMRSRTIDTSEGPFTWRLGDIINSTPQTVTAPAEGYHLIYNDMSYAKFYSHYKTRRHVVYFGGNDGMLHAVNAGFYSEKEKRFCLEKTESKLTLDETQDTLDIGRCQSSVEEEDAGVDAPALGEELWAYLPYNLHPHLKCLTDPDYTHKYYVDLKPRVFDVQIFPIDTDHPEGWGTILVGGLRLGGTPVTVPYMDGTTSKKQPFVSSYFILDITNPEKPPVLLGELTQELNTDMTNKWVDLGYSTVIPTMVVKKNGTTSEWYLVLGSGPHGDDGLKGVSDQQAKVSVIPLNKLVNSTATPVLRISNDEPTEDNNSGTFFLPAGEEEEPTYKGYVSDPITIDFDINPIPNGSYISDAVYFGTVEGNFDPNATLPYWQGGGHLYRLVMEPLGHEVGKDGDKTPYDWEIKPLLDLSGKFITVPPTVPSDPSVTKFVSTVPGNPIQPITAAPSVSTDGYNYWIYFGTGRFFDKDDKTDSTQQSFYGIKEPRSSIGNTLTWEKVELDKTVNAPGGKGLLQVDQILVKQSENNDADLSCRQNAVEPDPGYCLPSGISKFSQLEKYIAGTGNCTASDKDPSSVIDNCVDGWYKNFFPYNNRERNLGQATILGGLVTFTTYQPFGDICKPEGDSYLYAVYYKTGTSWHKNIFGDYGLDDEMYVKNKLELGRGLTTTPNLFTGDGEKGAKVFVQTSTGEIVEIKQVNLPIENYKTGRQRWKEFER
ncbi:hypothetical protein JWG42_15425 [Desulfoprunum benzoelyticum]|uniref:Type IV pilus assembly protein PilY1 n=1 Tax=Desulfoprunum benzoelyticum TaxID=1506996 RepID=A0A840UPI8_9BACT|nr:PilC/PilY family type IV pilus protein [Desulfoprunum benzoelyticum]MBB5346756.1 type IV pilus assembly protein PilY1 [Desulfoprunum benzoelyticum]MBM9531549.1 hypothetical protein [Desulfoprunum benzoelyticum]